MFEAHRIATNLCMFVWDKTFSLCFHGSEFRVQWTAVVQEVGQLRYELETTWFKL